MSGIDELAMMREVVYEVSSTVDCPLVLDTSHIDVMEEVLRIYPGRALINSISLESAKTDAMLALAKKYGAMFILLPLSDKGLPKNMTEKLEVLEQLYDKAMSHGLDHEDMIVDGLVTTIGANPAAGVECFETFTYCKEQRQLPTICGLSNISFGVPERGMVNTTFLTMAMAKGLTMAIANPCQEQLMNSMFAADMLLHHPEADVRFVEKMNRYEESEQDRKNVIYTDVVKGNGSVILEGVKTALSNGETPEEIINTYLIPAINEVGQLFNDNKYFLPQLIRSANTMKMAIDYLEPMLGKNETQEQLPTVIIATVKGDIHDIGKNLVALMLKNYGYPVIDMGKDVDTEAIIDKAVEVNAGFICLSALMTTTMMRMGDVVELAKQKGCKAKILVGGACITEDFAKEIGADGFARDAAECVKVVAGLR
jgi:5-methyltetrahydrofolate--homocysteine methyltransferase